MLLCASVLLFASHASAQANAPVAKEVLVFGQKIQYVEAGSGPTVILLHGLGGSSQAWQLNISALAQQYHVIVPDQIGFGKSDKPLVNYRIRTYVDFLDQFCKQLKIERASLVGNSMGGWIAALFTAAFPDRVDKLVLADAGGLRAAERLRHASLLRSESDDARWNESAGARRSSTTRSFTRMPLSIRRSLRVSRPATVTRSTASPSRSFAAKTFLTTRSRRLSDQR